jgi:Tol biopolymer transport system component
MTAPRDADRIIGAWLDLMPDVAPDRVVDAVLDAVDATPQPSQGRRARPLRATGRIAALAAAAIVVAVGALTLFRWAPEPSVAPPARPSATSPSVPAPEAPTEPPSPSAPRVFPGDRWILYVTPPPAPGLFLARPDGSDAHRIATEVTGLIADPTWSPDGEQIAFAVTDARTGIAGIWRAAADGTRATLLVGAGDACPDGVAGPDWSPDGGRISFVCRSTTDTAIHVFDLARGSISELGSVGTPDSIRSAPQWSPDGQTIAFEIALANPNAGRPAGGSQLATIPSSGGPIDRITPLDSLMRHPDWSPDGNLLAFNWMDPTAATARDDAGIGIVRPDGTGIRRVTAEVDMRDGLGEARWMPDGTALIAVGVIHTAPAQLLMVDTATGEYTGLGVSGLAPAPRPVP